MNPEQPEFVLLVSWVTLKRSEANRLKSLTFKKALALQRSLHTSHQDRSETQNHNIEQTVLSDTVLKTNTILCVHRLSRPVEKSVQSADDLLRLETVTEKIGDLKMCARGQWAVVSSTAVRVYSHGLEGRSQEIAMPCKQFMTSYISEFLFSESDYLAVLDLAGYKGGIEKLTRSGFQFPKRVLVYSSTCEFPLFVQYDEHSPQKSIRTGDAKLASGLEENPSVAPFALSTDGSRYFCYVTRENQIILYDLLKILRSQLNYSSPDPIYVDAPTGKRLHSVVISSNREIWCTTRCNNIYKVALPGTPSNNAKPSKSAPLLPNPILEEAYPTLKKDIQTELHARYPNHAAESWQLYPSTLQHIPPPLSCQKPQLKSKPSSPSSSQTSRSTLLLSTTATIPGQISPLTVYTLLAPQQPPRLVISADISPASNATPTTGSVYKYPRAYSLTVLGAPAHPTVVPVVSTYTHSVVDVLLVGRKKLVLLTARHRLHGEAPKHLCLTNGTTGGWSGFGRHWAVVYGMNFTVHLDIHVLPVHLRL